MTTGLVVAIALGLALVMPREVRSAREYHMTNVMYQDRFHAALQHITGPAVLFVRHADWHSPHYSLITNGPDWEQAPIWVVPDRGASRNAALLALAPGRRGLLFDEQRGQIDLYPSRAKPAISSHLSRPSRVRE